MSGWTLTESGRTFYRIIRAKEAVIDDFKSAKALGKPLRDPSQARAWEHGVFGLDFLERAGPGSFVPVLVGAVDRSDSYSARCPRRDRANGQ